MKKTLLTGLAIGLMTLGVTGIASANLIQNGGFELPLQAEGTWAIYNSIDGWTPVTNVEIRNNVAGAAYEGSNYAELDTTQNMAIKQTVTTVLGQQYKLTFAYSPRESVPSGSNGIDVFWNNESLTSLDLQGGDSGNDWVVYTFLVTGTGSDTLKFGASGYSNSYGGSLDAVTLDAVPEPATMLLFGTGILGLAGVARRKRS